MITKEQALKIPLLRADGKKNTEIADELGTTVYTVKYWVKRLKKSGYKVPHINKGGRPPIEL